MVELGLGGGGEGGEGGEGEMNGNTARRRDGGGGENARDKVPKMYTNNKQTRQNKERMLRAMGNRVRRGGWGGENSA